MLRALILGFFLCLSGLLGAQELKELQPIPLLSARVIDQTATLSSEQRTRLEARLAEFERQKGAQIALLMVSSVKPETATEYALRVVEKWQLGRRGIDDGVLLLVAKDDHKLRLEVGYGLEGALNDATAKRIISETIGPRFKQGDFYGGIDAGLTAVIKVLDGEVLPPPKPKTPASQPQPGSGFSFDNLLLFGFVLVFVVGGVLRSLFGRFLGAGIVGVAAGFIATLILPSLVLAIVLGVVAFVVSLLSGMGGGGGWIPGASSWGGGSGGGFSGGGGSFGGGGASGDW